jgi:hypothetical protein|tara:strand:+ start:735 stop:1058 length:324 start_codon:yes stop_codon:yes gene_type:complete
MTKQIYKIQGKEVYQEELTIGQDIQLIKIFSSIPQEEIEHVPKVINYLVENDLLAEVMQVILKGDISKIKVLDIKNSEFEAIYTDFLELNGGLVQKLTKLFAGEEAK